MALGGNDAQTAQGFYRLVVDLPFAPQSVDALGFGGLVQRRIGLNRFQRFFNIAAQHDVGSTASHVGRNGDHTPAARLGNDVGLARMLLGVEHLVRQLFLLQQFGNDFGVFDGGGTHQHRLAALMALADVGNRRLVFFLGGFVHPVQLVAAGAGPVGRNDHRLQPVDFLKLIGLGIRSAGHTR